MQTALFELPAEQDAKTCSFVQDALPTLSPHYAEILTRADLNEEPREQIAADLGLTANNVCVRLHRARQALKAKLEDICPTCRDRVGLGCDCEPAGATRSRLHRDPAKRNATAPGVSLSR